MKLKELEKRLGCKIKIVHKKNAKTLGDFNPGETVKLGEREYIVLGHDTDTTTVITKDIVKRMVFGETADYSESYVRRFCNEDFYKELAAAVGEDNIILHRVNLTGDDGSNKSNHCWDWVSIITTENYRKYREYIPTVCETCWAATSVTTSDDNYYARRVCIVGSDGVLDWDDCYFSGGVRPFCILNSSICVSG